MKGLPKMRRVLYIFIACIMMFTLAACGGGSSSEEGSTQQENSQDGAGSAVAEDALVVYFSTTGNTESVAEAIAETPVTTLCAMFLPIRSVLYFKNQFCLLGTKAGVNERFFASFDFF